MDESLSNKIFQFERGNTVHGKRSKKLVPNASSGRRLKVKDVKEAVEKLKDCWAYTYSEEGWLRMLENIFGKGLTNG